MMMFFLSQIKTSTHDPVRVYWNSPCGSDRASEAHTTLILSTHDVSTFNRMYFNYAIRPVIKVFL